MCVQVAISQWELPKEDPPWSDQCVILRLQQLGHGGPLRPSAVPPQTQTQGISRSWFPSCQMFIDNRDKVTLAISWNPKIRNLPVSSGQSLSGSLHNVAEDFSSSSPSLSTSSCSSSHPDLSSSSLPLSPESSSSSCSTQAMLPVYNKQVADSCIIRVSVESVSNGNVYKSILVSTLVS